MWFKVYDQAAKSQAAYLVGYFVGAVFTYNWGWSDFLTLVYGLWLVVAVCRAYVPDKEQTP